MVIFNIVGLFCIASGIAMVAVPETFWRLSRWFQKGQGLATADRPDGSALGNVRFRGIGAIVFGAIWLAIINLTF